MLPWSVSWSALWTDLSPTSRSSTKRRSSIVWLMFTNRLGQSCTLSICSLYIYYPQLPRTWPGCTRGLSCTQRLLAPGTNRCRASIDLFGQGTVPKGILGRSERGPWERDHIQQGLEEYQRPQCAPPHRLDRLLSLTFRWNCGPPIAVP